MVEFFLVCFYLNNLKAIFKINLLVFYTLIFFLLIILRQDISRDLFLIMRLPFFKDISFLFRCVLLPTSNLIKFLFLRAPISLFIRLLIWFYFFFSTLLYVTLLVFIAFHDTRWNKQELWHFLVLCQRLIISPFQPLY